MKHKLTDFDRDQISRYSYDEEHQAQRVVITGATDLKFEGIAQSKPEIIYVPQVIVEKSTETVQVPQIIIQKEIEIKEIVTEKVIIQTEYREIEKPVYIKEIQIVKCDVPVIQKEIQVVQVYRSSDSYIKIAFIAIQACATIGLLILNYLKH